MDESLVDKKVQEVRERVHRVRALLPEGVEEFLADQDRRELVAFNLILAIQALVDLAIGVAAQEGARIPDSMAGTFQVLSDQGRLDVDLAERLGAATRMRNLLVHRYGRVEDRLVFEVARDHLGDLLEAALRLAEPGPSS